MINYYSQLGVAQNATIPEIKRAYREGAKKFHPDRNPDNPKAEEKFKEIQDAYNVLSDDYKRMVYDREYSEWLFSRQQQHQHHREQNEQQSSAQRFFDSRFWQNVSTMAGNVARSAINHLDQELYEETQDVHPAVANSVDIKAKKDKSGLTITLHFTNENLKKITQMAAMGMDIDDYSSDVCTLVAIKLSRSIKRIWSTS